MARRVWREIKEGEKRGALGSRVVSRRQAESRLGSEEWGPLGRRAAGPGPRWRLAQHGQPRGHSSEWREVRCGLPVSPEGVSRERPPLAAVMTRTKGEEASGVGVRKTAVSGGAMALGQKG